MNEAYSSYSGEDFLSRSKGRSIRTLIPQSIYLLLPLLFFSTHGSVPILMTQGNNDFIAGTGVSSIRALAGMSIVAMIVIICVGAMQPVWKTLLSTFLREPLIAFLPILAILSAAWSQEPVTTVRKGVWLLVSTFFAIYLSRGMTPRQLARQLMFVGVVAALASIFLCLALPSYGVDHVGQNAGSWQGIYPQKNSFGMALVFLLTPVFLPSEASGVRQLHRVLYGLLLLFLIGMSQSRTSWGMAILYMALMVVLRIIGKFPRVQSTLLVALGGLIIICVAAVAYSHLDEVTALMGRDNTFSGRTVIWSAVMNSINKRPLLGYGYEGFWIGFQGEAVNVLLTARFSLTHAHDGFLNLWLDLGLVGLGGFILLLLPVMKNTLISFGPGRSPFVDWYIGLIFLTLVYNVDESFLLRNMDLQWILFLVGCLGLSEAARSTLASRAQTQWS